jgi:hypothetical protein
MDTHKLEISNLGQKSERPLRKAGLFKSKQGMNLEGTGLSNLDQAQNITILWPMLWLDDLFLWCP